jgi:hypothetical protein
MSDTAIGDQPDVKAGASGIAKDNVGQANATAQVGSST